jgi:hypothetical protein
MKPCMRRVCHEFPVVCDSGPGQTATRRWKTKFGALRKNSDLLNAANMMYCCGDGSRASAGRHTDSPHCRGGGVRNLVPRDSSESAPAQDDRRSDRSMSVAGVRYASRHVLLRLGRSSGHIHDLHPRTGEPRGVHGPRLSVSCNRPYSNARSRSHAASRCWQNTSSTIQRLVAVRSQKVRSSWIRPRAWRPDKDNSGRLCAHDSIPLKKANIPCIWRFPPG